MPVPHRKQTYEPPRPVDDVRTSQKTHLWASTAFYVDSFTSSYKMSVPHRKHTYELPRPVDDDLTSQKTGLGFSTPHKAQPDVCCM
jgi:hypothetical protein